MREARLLLLLLLLCTSVRQSTADDTDLWKTVTNWFGINPRLQSPVTRPAAASNVTAKQKSDQFIVLPKSYADTSRTSSYPRAQATGDVCGMPQVIGTGPYRIPRWYFNTATGRCELFYYSGCCGNANNYPTFENCQVLCEAANPCDQVLNEGEGTSNLQRWYYDKNSQTCQPFTYRGLRGNQNNFVTREECEDTCDVLVNPCLNGEPYKGTDNRPQTCNGQSSTSCPTKFYCHVGAGIETTVCCPGDQNSACTKPMLSGTGEASLNRWYYNQASRRCEQFTYYGLQGNENNFLSQDACSRICREVTNPCIGQPATTPSGQIVYCSATNKDQCPVNFWCHLGATPETTLCCPGATNPCSVPLAPGTGTDVLTRWYYDASNQECVSFRYNGIRGNQNNFLTQTSCQSTCPRELCNLSIDTGTSCGASATRYAFDRLTGNCRSFIYNGCGGNLNNFNTLTECNNICQNP